jgi:hypothetical protein
MPTIKELRDMIKSHKKEKVDCLPFSKMNKAGLLAHAQNLGLIEKDKKPKEKDNFENALDIISKSVENLEPTSQTGIKKKNSLIRRLQRIRSNKINEGEKDFIINKLKKQRDLLFELP